MSYDAKKPINYSVLYVRLLPKAIKQQRNKSSDISLGKGCEFYTVSKNQYNSTNVHPILSLQQTIGNQAVQRLLRSNVRFKFANILTMLEVSQDSDVYEKEAEHVAEQMTSTSLSSGSLRTARTDDYDKQIDQDCKRCNENKINTKGFEGTCSETSQDIIKGVDDTLHAEGSPLDSSIRVFMEPKFGFDFSKVRIHTDEQAAISAQTINAMAYTVGNNIVFGRGQYSPQTTEGKKLMAHELTHVVQQQSVLPQMVTYLAQHSKLNSKSEEKNVVRSVIVSNRTRTGTMKLLQMQRIEGGGATPGGRGGIDLIYLIMPPEEVSDIEDPRAFIKEMSDYITNTLGMKPKEVANLDEIFEDLAKYGRKQRVGRIRIVAHGGKHGQVVMTRPPESEGQDPYFKVDEVEKYARYVTQRPKELLRMSWPKML